MAVPTISPDRRAYRYAATHPDHWVYLCMGSSQGEHLWHIWADGSCGCEDASFGGYSRPTRRELRDFCSRHRVPAGTVVAFFGLRGRPLRVRWQG